MSEPVLKGDARAAGLVARVVTTPNGPARGPFREVHRHDHDDAEAVFVCCTNIPTYDLLGPLAQTLGKPVLTANEVLMHAALRGLGTRAVDVGLITAGG